MIQVFLIALISLLAQLILPWWSLAIVAFLICFWRSSGGLSAFFYGFFGIAIIWLAYALLIHFRTDGIFTARMGQLLFKMDNIVMPLLSTTILSGLVGGLAGLSGFFVRQASGNQTVNRRF